MHIVESKLPTIVIYLTMSDDKNLTSLFRSSLLSSSGEELLIIRYSSLQLETSYFDASVSGGIYSKTPSEEVSRGKTFSNTSFYYTNGRIKHTRT